MPQITAWQCDHTSQVFTSKAEYQQHLKKLARQRYERRTKDKFRQETNAHIRSTLRLASSFEDIGAWFVNPENWHFLANRVYRLGDEWGVRNPHIKPEKFKIKHFTLGKMRWDESCSNGHVAPDGKPKNWVRNPELPFGYPGWIGQLDFEYEDSQRLTTTDIFANTGIHTGSGSAGTTKNHGLRGRYSITLFAEEWPSLAVYQRLKQSVI